MAAPGELRFIFRVTFSTIGILVGTSVLIVFGFKFRNWNAAIWGMMSGHSTVNRNNNGHLKTDSSNSWPSNIQIGLFIPLTLAVTAAVTLYVHVANKQRKWDSYPNILKYYMLTGCFVQLAGVCGFVTYLSLAITNHQGLIINGEGYYLTSVWCFMTWKWGFLLFLYSRLYKRLYYHVYTILPKDDEVVNSYGGSS